MASYHCCDVCEKGVQVGNKVSHAKNRSRKVWKPNLQPKRVWLEEADSYVRMRLCVKCLRMFKALRLTPETRREGYEPSEEYKKMEQMVGYTPTN